jgi:hypothetical protein
MQSTLASLLLITSVVALTCFILNYAVTIVEITIQTKDIPQLERLRNLEDTIRNQTDALFCETQTQVLNGALP